MKLLYACTDPGIPVDGTKGASIHVRAMCRALAAEGHAVVLTAARWGDGRADEPAITRHPVTIDAAGRRRLAAASGGDSGAVRAGGLRAHLSARALAAAAPDWRAAGIDAVYERYSLFGTGGLAVARALGVPHILEVNAPLTVEAARYRALPWPRAAAAAERAVLRGADAVVAVSAPLADWIADQGVPPARILVLPNGVDATAIAAGAGRRTSERARLGLSGRAVVGFVGSIRPWHGVDDLVEAFACAAADRPDARLLIVGDGPARPALEARAGKLGILSRVRFTGAVRHEDVPGLLAACDAAVAPYAADAAGYFSPLKLLEYLAAGVPTVAADVDGVRAVVRGGRGALLYRAGDVGALAAGITALLEDPAAARALGAAGRANVVAHHTWGHNARAVLARLAALGARDAVAA